MAVAASVLTPFLLITLNLCSFIRSSFIASPSPVNLSTFLYPRVTSLAESTSSPSSTHFLKGVLAAIAAKEKWEAEDIHVSQIDVNKAKFRLMQHYEFRIRLGKSSILVKMNEDISEWKKLESRGDNRTSELEDFLAENNSEISIDRFTITGPFDMLAAGDNDVLSLVLPLNRTYTGLRKISVGEGITVDIKGADEISTFLTPMNQEVLYRFSPHMKLGEEEESICRTLNSVRLRGAASVTAYRISRASAPIESIFSTRDTIRLLPDKCYIRSMQHLSPFTNKIPLLERLLTFLNQKLHFSAVITSVKTRTLASTIFRFPLELDHYIRNNDARWSTLDEWRTRPVKERAWFEVVASFDEGILKPIVVKRVRPLMDAVSYSWSSLLSNMSFTKFPSLMVAPDPLTLDVKW